MTTCIYYELERIDAADVEAALDVADAHAGDRVHAHWADAPWTAAAVDDRLPIEGPRSNEFRVELAETMQAWAVELRSSPHLRRPLSVHSVDVLDVGWFDWFFSTSAIAHRAWVVERLLARFRPTRLVVVTAAVRGPGSWADVGDQLGRRGVALHVVRRHAGARATQPSLVPLLRRGARTARSWAELLGPRSTPARQAGNGPTVVFAEDFPHLATVLVEPARLLHESGRLDVQLIGSAGVVALAPEGVPGTRVEAAVPRVRRAEALVAGARAARAAGPALELGAARGVAPFGLSAAAFTDGLRLAAASAWWKAGFSIALWDALLRRSRPQVLVTATYTGNAAERAAVLAAPGAAPGCQAAFVQHGLVSGEPWKVRLIHDHFLVWGEHGRRHLLAAGAAPDRVVATGSAKFEGLVTRVASTAAPRARVKVLFLPSRTGGRFVSRGQADAMLHLVREATGRLQGAELTLKVHPDDRSRLFESIDGVTVVARGDTPSLIAEADVVIVATSTAGIEACALDRPVVVLTLAGIESPVDYERYGAALEASNVDELEAAIVSATTDGETIERLRAGRRALVDDVFAGMRPGAAVRIAQHISALAGEPLVPDPGEPERSTR